MTINVTALQRQLEAQKRIINALQNENHWLQDVIFNPSFNEIDIRLMVETTPQEVRCGLISIEEAPERKIYYPALAEKVFCSDKVASERLRKLAKKAGAFSYRRAYDIDEQGKQSENPRVFIKPTALAETPAQIDLERAKRGGSTWQDGKRIKRCPECDSPVLLRRSQYWCQNPNCQHQFETTWKSVNNTDDIGDAEQETPNCHIDGLLAEDTEEAPEISKLPTLTVDTGIVLLEVLKSRRIWSGMRLEPDEKTGKLNKVPYIADLPGEKRASSTNPSTWRTFEYVMDCYEKLQTTDRPFDGIMFMCDGTFTFMDQDHCRNKETGEITPDAMERARRINSYTEESFSGDGIHTYSWGILPPGRRRDSHLGVEMYDSARPCVFTGKPIPEFPLTMEHRQEEVHMLHAELFPEPPKIERLWNAPGSDNTSSISDEDILKKARNAKNGAKFRLLFDDGEWKKVLNEQGERRYPSQSEADQALCEMLAYWGGCDVSTIERLFQQSGLMSEKWERADYRQLTINGVLGMQERRAS